MIFGFIYSLYILGKTRYGICVNFYRPLERVKVHRSSSRVTKSTFRRDSWRKSTEKSFDSAISR